MNHLKALAEIKQSKDKLEFDLACAVNNIISKWTEESGLIISEVNIHTTPTYTLGEPTKNVITEISVSIDYEANLQ